MERYKVILVDDEEEVIDVMEAKIRWNELGFEVVGSATNGVKALELIEKLQPDVVLTDIKMPYMDGLELARRVRADYPNIYIMLCTGFDEFEYAKEAVHLEIKEYMLKPINAVELSECLTRLKDTLDKEREEKLNVKKLEDYFQEALPALKSNFLISLIEGRMIEKDDRDVCVISKELAELNHLKTGNLLKFNDYHDKEHSTIYSAEIIGIYETKQERKSIMYGDSYRPENTIFTDMSFPEKPSGNEGNPFYQYAIFKVQNAGKYDQVKKSVQKANIDWSRYDLIDNNGNIKNMTENFGQMDQMSMGLLLIVSVSGLVILVLVFLFWIKNRTQEIGIMMSLGKCKFEIWVQFLWEAVMISIIGMLLSFAISPIIAETSASYLAKETQTLRLEQQEQENTGTYIDGYIAPDLKIQDVEVHITKEMVLMDIGMISGILIIAVLVAGITIMKKRPKQILSEMS